MKVMQKETGVCQGDLGRSHPLVPSIVSLLFGRGAKSCTRTFMSTLVAVVMTTLSVASKNTLPAYKALSGFICEHGDTMLHLAVCAHCSRTAFHSVRLDEWAAIRERPPPSGRRERIFRVRRRAAKVTALIGAGYTPRIVFLAGMMLRSLQVRPSCVGVLASASFSRAPRGQPL
jgi:hypothetical protein